MHPFNERLRRSADSLPSLRTRFQDLLKREDCASRYWGMLEPEALKTLRSDILEIFQQTWAALEVPPLDVDRSVLVHLTSAVVHRELSPQGGLPIVLIGGPGTAVLQAIGLAIAALCTKFTAVYVESPSEEEAIPWEADMLLVDNWLGEPPRLISYAKWKTLIVAGPSDLRDRIHRIPHFPKFLFGVHELTGPGGD